MNNNIHQQIEEWKTKGIIDLIIKKDNEIFLNRDRTNQFHRFINRTFILDQVKIKIKVRRYYKVINNKKHTYFLKEQYDIFEKGTKFDSLFKDKVFQLSLSGMSYREILKCLNSTISIGGISNIVGSHVYQQQAPKSYKELVEDLNITNLYIEIDDSYQPIKSDFTIRKIRNRMIAIHLGKDKDNHVIGKSIILETKFLNEIHLNNAEICQIIKQKITEIYGSKGFKIQVIGDGARWIKRIAKMLNSTYILDKFHLEKMAFSTFGYGKYNTINKKIFQDLSTNGITFYKSVMTLLYENKFDIAIDYLHSFISNSRNIYLSKEKINEILDFIKYLRNNREGIENYQNKNYIGSRTELFISHLIKKKTTKKFSIFGLKSFKNILKNTENKNLQYIFI